MPVPHFNIKITQRSKGKSAVAGAAYQAGEKLFSEYDQKTKNYTCKKEVVYTEIMLPPNAPPEYADRATLWNSVEEIEKQWNSQLARRFVVALPREVPMEMLPQMVKEYCEEHFVSKGMCCDFAIHDPYPPGHNPHCHFMLTMRAIDENGKWLPKSRKVYDLDENGERIKLPSGRWKSHKEDTVDWNEQYHAEEWRHGWEVVQNKYLELAGSPERIDISQIGLCSRFFEARCRTSLPITHPVWLFYFKEVLHDTEHNHSKSTQGSSGRNIQHENGKHHLCYRRSLQQRKQGHLRGQDEAFNA